MITDLNEALSLCTVDGLHVKTPSEEVDRKTYVSLKKHLEMLGGVWKGGKTFAFVFKKDPTLLLQKVQSGEVVNLKKEYQFFATPPEVADEMVKLLLPEPEHDFLEPSAGQGALIHALIRSGIKADKIWCYEAMETNLDILDHDAELEFVNFIGRDFLTATPQFKMYDRILANPPFAKNQDIDHIYKMWEVLKPGGRIVTLASKHWKLSDNKKEKGFREFIEQHGYEAFELEDRCFKTSGTLIIPALLVFNK